MSKRPFFALLISITAHIAAAMTYGQPETEEKTISMGAVQAPVVLSFSTVTPPPPEPVIEEPKPEPKPEPEPEPLPEPVEEAKPVLEKPEPEPEPEEAPEEKIEEQPPEPEPEPITERTAVEESEVDGLSDDPVMVSEPAIRNWVEPRYPRSAQRRNHQGVVMLDVVVGEEGNPEEITILTSSGHAALDQAAIVSVSQWSFEPEQRNNQFVKSRVHIPVAFQLN